MPSNFDMIEDVYGRDAAESVRKMMDLAQEAVAKVHDLYLQINALEADNQRLRDALRAFAASFEDSCNEDGESLPLGILIEHGTGWDMPDNWRVILFGKSLEELTTDHLRAAYLALHPDDTGGEDDD